MSSQSGWVTSVFLAHRVQSRAAEPTIAHKFTDSLRSDLLHSEDVTQFRLSQGRACERESALLPSGEFTRGASGRFLKGEFLLDLHSRSRVEQCKCYVNRKTSRRHPG